MNSRLIRTDNFIHIRPTLDIFHKHITQSGLETGIDEETTGKSKPGNSTYVEYKSKKGL